MKRGSEIRRERNLTRRDLDRLWGDIWIPWAEENDEFNLRGLFGLEPNVYPEAEEEVEVYRFGHAIPWEYLEWYWDEPPPVARGG